VYTVLNTGWDSLRKLVLLWCLLC